MKEIENADMKDQDMQKSKLQTSCPGGLIWYIQKLWSSKEHASGQVMNPWKQDTSGQSHTDKA